MKTSKLFMGCSFNVMDESDAFEIKGSIFNFDVSKINLFALLYMNMKVNGIFDELLSNIDGNKSTSNGTFAMEYDDLKITVLKNGKKERKKNKILTAIGNLFVKKDSNDTTEEVAITAERDEEKSFFNYLWLNISDGLKKILL